MSIANKLKRRNTGSKRPASKPVARASKPKPATGTRKPATGTRSSTTHPWSDIAESYKLGKSWSEIADQFKIKRSSMNGISDRLAVGVNVNGTVVKISRGKRKKAA